MKTDLDKAEICINFNYSISCSEFAICISKTINYSKQRNHHKSIRLRIKNNCKHITEFLNKILRFLFILSSFTANKSWQRWLINAFLMYF